MPSPAGVLTEPPVVLLTLQHAGRTWRASSRPLSVSDGARTYLYRGGLAPSDVYREAPITGVAEPQSQTIELLVDGDLAELSSQMQVPSEITAEVALIRAGDEWGQRLVMLQGPVDVQQVGVRGQPVRLRVLGDDPSLLATVYPRPSHAISNETWGEFPWGFSEAVEGRVYPQIYGEAGYIWAGASRADLAAIPIYPVILSNDTPFIRYTPWGDISDWVGWPPPGGNYGIVSLGWTYPGAGPPNRGVIKAWLNDGGVVPETQDAHLYYCHDMRGQVVTVARVLYGGFPVSGGGFSPGREYYGTIRTPCCGGVREDYSDGLRGAGEIIEAALRRTARRVDWRRAAPVMDQLNIYELAGFTDVSQDPWRWLCDEIFPLLPCSWVTGPEGLYPVVWRLDASPATCDAPLTDGLDCTIEGGITYEDQPGQVLHSMEYAYGIYSDNYQRRATWDGRAGRHPRVSGSLHLRRAQLRYGRQVGADLASNERIESTAMIYLDSTADLVLGWQARIKSEPPGQIRVVGDGLRHRGALARLEPGMAVRFTSTRLSLTDRVVHVRRAGWLGGLCYADLMILPEL